MFALIILQFCGPDTQFCQNYAIRGILNLANLGILQALDSVVWLGVKPFFNR